MMKRRSIITTTFCLAEIAFIVIILILTEQVISSALSWNKRVKENGFEPVDTLLGCNSSTSNQTKTCCMSQSKPSYGSWKTYKRNVDTLKAMTAPLIAIAGSSLYAAVVINFGSISVASFASKICHRVSERCLRKLASVFWFSCWGVEAALCFFAITVLAVGLERLTPEKFRFHDLCQDMGHERLQPTVLGSRAPGDVEWFWKVHCFQKLRVCPGLEERALFASTLICFYVLFCVASKICFRIFMDAEDNDRPKCQNCCKWSRLLEKCCGKKEELPNCSSDTTAVKPELRADSVTSLYLGEFHNTEQKEGPAETVPPATTSS